MPPPHPAADPAGTPFNRLVECYVPVRRRNSMRIQARLYLFEYFFLRARADRNKNVRDPAPGESTNQKIVRHFCQKN